MADPMAGKYKKPFKREFVMAELVLAPYGGKLEWSQNDYEAFRFTSPGVTLIFYPHKTSAGHHHIRIREQNSKSKALAHELMARLDVAAGHCCTFSSKHLQSAHFKFGIEHKIEHGWADKRVDWRGNLVEPKRANATNRTN